MLRSPPDRGGDPHDHTGNAMLDDQAAISGTLVGFFSKHHQGAFTHMGQNVHAHLVNTLAGLAAHADQVSIRASSTLVLPR